MQGRGSEILSDGGGEGGGGVEAQDEGGKCPEGS